MAKKTTYFAIGSLLIAILATAIIIQLPSANVQLKITHDDAIFYIKDGNKYIISGVEQGRLLTGTKTITRVTKDIVLLNQTSPEGYFQVIRQTPYNNGATIREIWNYDPTNTEVINFPVSHLVEITNAKSNSYRYTVSKLADTGPKRPLTNENVISFGRKMKVELNPGYEWAWIGYPHGKDTLSAQYKITKDVQTFNFRLFDPPVISFVSPTPTNGSTISTVPGSIFVNLSTTSNGGKRHYSFVDFNRDLILWQRFDEVNASGDPTDLSSYSFNGSLFGTATINSSADISYSSNFKAVAVINQLTRGGTEYIDIPNINVTKMAWPNGSLSYWVNYTKTEPVGFARYISNERDNNRGLVIRREAGANQTEFRIYDTTGTAFGAIDENGIINTSFGQWIHYVLTWENGVAMKVYRNGTLTATDSIFNGQPDGGNFIRIGQITTSTADTDNDFQLDELMIFNRTLNSGEVSSLFNATTTQYARNFSSLNAGEYTFTGYAVNSTDATKNSTTRTVTISLGITTIPISEIFNITFLNPFSGISIFSLNFDTNGTSYTAQPAMSNPTGEQTTIVLMNNGTNADITPPSNQNNLIARAYNMTYMGLDGLNDYITLENKSINYNNFTISFWFNKSNTQQINDTVINYQNENKTDGFGFIFPDANREALQFSIGNGTNQTSNLTSSTLLNNTWYFVTGVYQRDLVIFYINGTQIGNLTNISLIAPNPSINLTIGSNRTALFFNGTFDELRIYNRSINSSEITEIYNSSRVRNTTIVTNGLVSYLSFNENQGTIAYDGIGSNNGSISGATYFADGINISLISNTEYLVLGNKFQLTNPDYSWSQLRLNWTVNQNINSSITTVVGPNAISLLDWVQNNYFVRQIRNYFGNIPAIASPYNRNYSSYILVSGGAGEVVTARINITAQLDALDTSIKNLTPFSNTSMVLTGTSIYGGNLSYNSTQEQIPFYVSTN